MPSNLRLRLLLRSAPFKFALLSLLALIVLYVWHTYYYLPQQATLHSIESRLSSAESRLHEAEHARDSLPALIKQQRVLADSLLKYRGALPNHFDVPSFIKRLIDYANDSHVTIDKISRFKSPNKLSELDAYGIRMSLKAKFADILHFIAHLDGDPQVLILSPPSFHAAGEGKVSTSVQITALYKKEGSK